MRVHDVPWPWIAAAGGGITFTGLLVLAVSLWAAGAALERRDEPTPSIQRVAVAMPAVVQEPMQPVPPEQPANVLLLEEQEVIPEPLPQPLPKPAGPIIPEEEAPPVLAKPAVASVQELEPVKVDVEKPKRVFRKDFDRNVYASCEQIGSNVLFMKDPPEAFKRARADKKLVFIVHLSGNLEDPDFT
jgi:hypothetical protein